MNLQLIALIFDISAAIMAVLAFVFLAISELVPVGHKSYRFERYMFWAALYTVFWIVVRGSLYILAWLHPAFFERLLT